MVLLVQITSILVIALICAKAEAPPGYVKPLEAPHNHPPKYEYGYNIEDGKGEGQGKAETRDGIYALGRYYVDGTDSKQSVQYYADDWGYHPLVEYSNVGPHSKSTTSLLLGVEAVKAVATNKFAPSSVPANKHVSDTISKINQNRSGQQLSYSQPAQQVSYAQPAQQINYIQQPQQVVVQQSLQQQKQVIIQQEQPQQLIYYQQQQLPQQNIVVQHQIQENFVVPPPQPQVYVQNEAIPVAETSGKAINTQQVIQHNEYDEASLYQAGGYGTKINIKHTPSKLIQTARKLVSGEDVLNINGAVINESIETTNIESSTAKSIVTEYSSAAEGILQIDNRGDTGYSSTTIAPPVTITETSLIKEPIVVEDYEDKSISSTTASYSDNKQEVFSTTGNTIETVSTNSYDTTEPSTILVTPRPVSTNFLAPITAGIQLQNVENTASIDHGRQEQNYFVEIQKSLPYYLGKFEYIQNPTGGVYSQSTVTTETKTHKDVQEKAVENIELGKTLLTLPEPQALIQHNNIFVQQPPEHIIRENFIEVDQQQAQGLQDHVSVQQVPVVVEKVVEKEVPYPVVETNIIERPVEVTKVVNKPYPVEVPVHVPVQVPVPIKKHIPVPVTVEKIVEKPIHYTQVVEKPVHIPRPYPVEKIVDRPVHVPVEVTRYIDRPYPVQVPVAQPVPYPVDRIVEKIVKQPYPVEVRVPVQVKVPVPVEKIIEKKVPVHHYVDRPVPYEKIVEKPIHYYIDRPYPVEVKVPVHVPQPYAVSYALPTIKAPAIQQSQKYQITTSVQNIQQQQQQEQQNSYVFASPYYSYAPAIKEYLPPKQNVKVNNGYLPPVHDCDQQNSYSNKNAYYTIKSDDYIGLLPPKLQAAGNLGNYPRKYRSARSNFNTNLRVEYGFMPPLIPSLEIDENGNPLEKEDNK